MRARHAWGAAAVYLAVAVYATWPLLPGLSRDVPSDLGDPVLNMWILSWDCEQLLAILGGDLSRIGTFFNANIFFPAPLTLAYSEHLFPQALQILPLYAATRDPILCYNVLFLSTYVLSGVGAFLLVRELSGNPRAGFLAGLLFAFALYRVPQVAHLQVLSSQWMPFALYGFTAYLNRGRLTALAGGTLALVAQGLSCGYYLVYFVPFGAAYILWELHRRTLWRDARIWRHLLTAGIAALALLAPFLIPYNQVQRQFDMSRDLEEVSQFSADVYSYFTAFPNQRLWGDLLQTYPRDEAQLFPGAIPLALGVIALVTWCVQAWRAGTATHDNRRGVSILLGSAAAAMAMLMLLAVFQRRIVVELPLLTFRMTSLGRTLSIAAATVVALLAVSPRARMRARALVTPLGFFCVAAIIAWWLSLGPEPRAFGRVFELPAPYGFLYEHVPGFDGLRVPARYAMVVTFMLTIAGALAIAPWLRGRRGTALVAIVSVLFLIEAPAAAFRLNAVGAGRGYAAPEPRVYRPSRAPRIYQHVQRLPQEAVILEMPIGEPTWDTFATYYSTTHWRPLINGYSGYFPRSYALVALGLQDPDRDPETARLTLLSSGATHVLLHERAYRPAEVEQITRWLATIGAQPIAREDSDVLYLVRSAP